MHVRIRSENTSVKLKKRWQKIDLIENISYTENTIELVVSVS